MIATPIAGRGTTNVHWWDYLLCGLVSMVGTALGIGIVGWIVEGREVKRPEPPHRALLLCYGCGCENAGSSPYSSTSGTWKYIPQLCVSCFSKAKKALGREW